MVTKTNTDLSGMMDGELSDAQIDQMLVRMSSDPALRQSWDEYHAVGDAIASDDLAMTLSDDFMIKMRARLEQEPVVLAPKQMRMPSSSESQDAQSGAGFGGKLSGTRISLSLALTSVAATVMLTLLMVPQITTLLQHSQPSSPLAKVDGQDASFSTQIKLANNTNNTNNTNNASGTASVNANPAASASGANRDTEFAPRLENQVEMLRDPRLDSYLLAHQKVSPTLDNGGRYIKRANVTASSDTEK